MDLNETEQNNDNRQDPRPVDVSNPVFLQFAVSSVVVFMLLAVVLVALGFRRPNSEPLSQRLATEGPGVEANNQVDPLELNVHQMPIPFGAKARATCLQKCTAPNINMQLCESVCDQRRADDFARSLIWQGKKAKSIAQKIATACLKRAPTSAEEISPEEWAKKTEKIIKYLRITSADIEWYQRSLLLERFEQAEKIDEIIPPVGGASRTQKAFLRQLRGSLCMRQSIATTQLAVLTAAKNADQLSERFYREIEQSLLVSLETLETPLAAAHMASLVGNEKTTVH